ncbi:MAG: sensor domain-containing diguanylate cyclase [Lachnospiraceae bacterium]|nr:sensor domain-containing diguanylate cyclase [Lachnospiraceae bacterium]
MSRNNGEDLTIKKHISARQVIRRMGIKQMLSFLLLPLFLIFLIFMNFRMMYGIIADNIRYDGEYRVRKYSVAFEDSLAGGVKSMEYISYNLEHMLKSDASNEEILDFIVKETETYSEEFDADSTGIYGFIRDEYMDGVGWVPDEFYVPTARPWYVDAKKQAGDLTYVAPYVDEMTGDTIMTLAKLLSDGKSVVAVDLKLNELQELTDSLLAVSDKGTYVVVLDEDGTVVAHTLADQVGHNYLKEDIQPGHDIATELLLEHEDQFDVSWSGGSDYVFSRELGGGWYVLSVTNESQTFARVFEAIRSSVIVAVIGALMIIIVLMRMTLQRIKAEDYDANLRTIAGIYLCMYKMDLISDTFEEINCFSDDIAALIGGKGTEAAKTLKKLVSSLTDARSREEMIEFADVSTLSERMKKTDHLTIEFINHKDIWCRGRFLAADREADGKLKSVIWTIEYIDEEKRSRDRLQYLSETDAMTGINNRGSGESKIRKALLNGKGGTFMLLDVDKFKSINDNYGHDVGDKVLIAIAECMMRSFRDNDIIMRLGGDEFAVYTPHVCSRESSSAIVERFTNGLKRLRITEMGRTPIEVSIGVAFYTPTDHFSFDDLYKRADKCAYDSKSHKGIYVTYYE